MNKILYIIFLFVLFILSGCSSSKETDNEDRKTEEEKNTGKDLSDEAGLRIIEIAKEEQKNEMYSSLSDSAYLYWLDNQLIILENSSKCNIYALNVLFKSGYKCPAENVLTYDLMDTSLFNDILPVVNFHNENDLLRGDLIIWNGHVIIYDSFIYLNDELYAYAWWAGTNQENNGTNIINDVAFGKYPLKGYFIIRRPVKRSH